VLAGGPKQARARERARARAPWRWQQKPRVARWQQRAEEGAERQQCGHAMSHY
jgi:hypothetical protein